MDDTFLHYPFPGFHSSIPSKQFNLCNNPYTTSGTVHIINRPQVSENSILPMNLPTPTQYADYTLLRTINRTLEFFFPCKINFAGNADELQMLQHQLRFVCKLPIHLFISNAKQISPKTISNSKTTSPFKKTNFFYFLPVLLTTSDVEY